MEETEYDLLSNLQEVLITTINEYLTPKYLLERLVIVTEWRRLLENAGQSLEELKCPFNEDDWQEWLADCYNIQEGEWC